MAEKIKLIVNAIPLTYVNTGIGRYLQSLYSQMERLYGNRIEIAYFDGRKVCTQIPRQPVNLSQWSKAADLFWKLPTCCALALRLALHARREILFRRHARGFDIYHEVAFFPFSTPSHVKTIFTVHDLSLIRFPEHHPRERALYSRLFFERRCKNVDHFIAVSEFTRKEMQTHLGIQPGKITTTRLAHSPDIFFPKSSEQIQRFLRKHSLPREYFLFVGSGDPRKNMDIIPEALEKSGLDIPLVVIGWSGWSTGGLGKKVISLGYVDDEDLALAYSGALALVLPSTYEGFGLPVLEAMACGCPVVTTKKASLPEVGGDAALYIKDPRDNTELAGLLKELYLDRTLRAEPVQKGIKHTGQFSWEQTAGQTFEVFERALDTPASG